MSDRSLLELHARRELLLGELAFQRARIDEVLTADAATQTSPISDFPRSFVMKTLLSRPALLMTVVAVATRFVGARVIARFPNAYAGLQLLRSLMMAARE